VVNKETGYILSDKSPAAGDSSETPRHLTKPEFARRVYEAMNNKGWYPSQLSRASGLSRNNISSYINGRSYPSRRSLTMLSKALGVKAETLLPNATASMLKAEQAPEISLTSSSAEPNTSWLTINTRVSTDIGIEILTLLKQEREGAKRK
jgi:transcriptional regulator with XRE-family HTH domain